MAARYDAFLFDLDGVLYRGSDPIDGAPQVVARIVDAGKGVAFVTNNSGSTPEAIVTKLTNIGVPARVEMIESSALTTAQVLARRGVGTSFVIGGPGLRTALQEQGIEVLEGEPTSADTVVVGFDRDADYTKVRVASVLVQRGSTLVGTNADASFPAPGGEHWPGAGSLLAAVEVATGTRGEVIGKPHAPIFEAALERAGGGTPLVVGDRVDTDIAGAAALGWDSLLVLTGVTRPADVPSIDPQATLVAEGLSVLVDPTVS
jgi:HAD superfamily hydrolase (TIGR01450 family)